MQSTREYILTLLCPDASAIVHAVSRLLCQAARNSVDWQQLGDVKGGGASGRFFMPAD